jgi:hypothetical protein
MGFVEMDVRIHQTRKHHYSFRIDDGGSGGRRSGFPRESD